MTPSSCWALAVLGNEIKSKGSGGADLALPARVRHNEGHDVRLSRELGAGLEESRPVPSCCVRVKRAATQTPRDRKALREDFDRFQPLRGMDAVE